jgi:thiol-disulfide isomerase/thioredoxin
MHRVLLLALVLSACAGARKPAPHPLVGTTANVTASDLDGREVSVAADTGRVRVVDFWATWCEPCREQLPALDRLARAYGERGLAVYGVAFDEDLAMVEAFVREAPVAFPILWDKGGARLSDPYGITRLPTTLVVDRAGRVRSVHLGFDLAAERALEAEVRRLLDE